MKKYILILTLLVSLTASAQWSGTNPITTLNPVGIGTTAPATGLKLELANSGVSSPYIFGLSTYNSTNTNFSGIRLNRARNTLASPTDVLAGDLVGSIFGSGRINAAFRDIASIQFGVGATPSSTSYPGYITFNTVPTGSTVMAERMRIMEGGNVGIGTNNPTAKLEVAGSMMRLKNTVAPGAITYEVDNGGIVGVFESVIATPNKVQAGSRSNYDFGLISNNLTRMTIRNDGNIGIGTTTPTYLLDLLSTTNAKLRVQSNSAPNSALIEVVSSAATGVFESVMTPTTLVRAGSRTGDFALISNNTDQIVVKSNGMVGIGTSTPEVKLAVQGDIRWGTTSMLKIDQGSAIEMRGTGTPYIDLSNDGSVDYDARFVLNSDDVLMLDGVNFAIGTPLSSNPNAYKLAVNGKIGAKDLQIERTTWPDYVFSDTYQLPSLAEVEQFIKQNNHLKDVPSAETVKKDGYSVGTMDEVLLKKVEELTLYIIEQQKQIDALKKEMAEAKKKN